MPLPLPLQPPESWGIWAHSSRKMHGREVTNSGPSPWGELWSSGASVDECLGASLLPWSPGPWWSRAWRKEKQGSRQNTAPPM